MVTNQSHVISLLKLNWLHINCTTMSSIWMVRTFQKPDSENYGIPIISVFRHPIFHYYFICISKNNIKVLLIRVISMYFLLIKTERPQISVKLLLITNSWLWLFHVQGKFLASHFCLFLFFEKQNFEIWELEAGWMENDEQFCNKIGVRWLSLFIGDPIKRLKVRWRPLLPRRRSKRAGVVLAYCGAAVVTC